MSTTHNEVADKNQAASSPDAKNPPVNWSLDLTAPEEALTPDLDAYLSTQSTLKNPNSDIVADIERRHAERLRLTVETESVQHHAERVRQAAEYAAASAAQDADAAKAKERSRWNTLKTKAIAAAVRVIRAPRRSYRLSSAKSSSSDSDSDGGEPPPPYSEFFAPARTVSPEAQAEQRSMASAFVAAVETYLALDPLLHSRTELACRALAVGPCGFGKTHVALDIAQRLLAKWLDFKLIITSRSKRVVAQLIRLFDQHGLLDRVVIITSKMLAKQLDLVSEADFVLIDELHEAFYCESVEYGSILGAAKRYGGLTWTPYRLVSRNNVPIYDHVNLDGEQIAAPFAPPCYVVTAERVAELKLYMPVQVAPVNPSTQITRVKFDKRRGDFIVSPIEVMSDEFNQSVCDDILHVFDATGRRLPSFYWGETTDQCDAFSAVAATRGLRIEPIHSKTEPTPAQEAAIIGRLRRGEIDGIASVRMLSVGFDYPEASLGIVAFKTLSRVRIVQIIGRLCRYLEGKIGPFLLDYGDHFSRFGSFDYSPAEALEFNLRQQREEREKTEREKHLAEMKEDRGERVTRVSMTPDQFRDFREDTFKIILAAPKVREDWNGVPYSVVVFVLDTGAVTELWLGNDANKWRYENITQAFFQATGAVADFVGGFREIALLAKKFEGLSILVRRIKQKGQGAKIAPVAFFNTDGEFFSFDDAEVFDPHTPKGPPLLKFKSGDTVWVEFVSAPALYERDEDECPRHLARVIDNYTGKEHSLIMNKLLLSDLTNAFPDEGYVGRHFTIEKHGGAISHNGRPYYTFTINETYPPEGMSDAAE